MAWYTTSTTSRSITISGLCIQRTTLGTNILSWAVMGAGAKRHNLSVVERYASGKCVALVCWCRDGRNPRQVRPCRGECSVEYHPFRDRWYSERCSFGRVCQFEEFFARRDREKFRGWLAR